MHCFLKMRQKKREKEESLAREMNWKKKSLRQSFHGAILLWFCTESHRRKDEYCKYGNMIREMMKEEEEEVATKQKPNMRRC